MLITHKKCLKYTINTFFTYKNKKRDNYRIFFSYHSNISPYSFSILTAENFVKKPPLGRKKNLELKLRLILLVKTCHKD
jgi:hypothetical protein